jgi:WD40 repeat protein
VVFNSDNTKAAVAFENGNIELYKLGLYLDANSGQLPRVTIRLQGPAEIPLAIVFSPDDQWLAHLSHSNLTFFNLKEITKIFQQADAIWKGDGGESDAKEAWESLLVLGEEVKQHSFSKSVPSGPAGALAFNPAGDLLAVGTAVGWQIWDVEQQELVMEKEAEGVYALTFSPDGRWFAWGDANGVVHLWAVLQ